MSIGININWDAQEIVDMLVEVISLLLEQKMGLVMMLGIVVVIGGFFLLTFGVCCGMCCYAFTKRRSKRLCMFCTRLCWDKCCGDSFAFEYADDAAKDDEEKYIMGNGRNGCPKKKKNHHGSNTSVTPV